MKNWILSAVGFLCGFALHGQGEEIVPTRHFDRLNGLPVKVVYNLCRDRDGFIWFCAENGVFRFDGKLFYQYSAQDGLCDNGILEIFADSRNNIWCAGFNGKISVIENGLVDTEDDFIKNWNSEEFICDIAEDKVGNVYLASEHGEFFRVDTQKKTSLMHVFGGDLRGMGAYGDMVWFLGYRKSFVYERGTGFRSMAYKLEYSFRDSVFMSRPNGSIWHLMRDGNVRNIFNGDQINLKKYTNNKITSVLQVDRRFVVIGLFNDGAVLCDLYTGGIRRIRLPQKARIVDAVKDDQGNIWLSAYSDGLFAIKTPSDLEPENKLAHFRGNILNMFKEEEKVYAINSEGEFFCAGPGGEDKMDLPLDVPGGKSILSYAVFLKHGPHLFLTSDVGLFHIVNGKPVNLGLGGKDLFIYGDSVMFHRTSHVINTRDFGFEKILAYDPLKIIFHHRAFAFCLIGTRLWISSKSGLCYYDLVSKKTSDILHRVKNNGRIEDIQPWRKNILVFATGNSGVGIMKDDSLVAQITSENGLFDNDCREIDSCRRGWVVRHPLGLSFVDIYSNRIQTISQWEGIPISLVNSMNIYGDRIYLSTTAGLVAADLSSLFLPVAEKRRVRFLKITADDRRLGAEGIVLGYDGNKLKIEFALPEYDQPYQIQYHWRINEGEWNGTNSTSIELADLRSGDYVFQVRAKAPGFDWSPVSELKFTVETPFWQSWFFMVFMGVVVIAGIWIFQRRFYGRKLEREREKASIRHQLMSYEQKALNAMMNPHFVFNAMGSIQYLLTEGQMEQANDYLVKFSRLIRKSLETSQMEFCLLDDEIERLILYLQLEKMRLEEAMSFRIEVGDDVDPEHIRIPTMILQTYVENAVIHGSGTDGRRTRITLSFTLEEDILLAVIEDDGPGFDTADTTRRSKRFGSMATQKRLELLTQITGRPYQVNMISPVGPHGGTRVELRFSVVE